MNNRKEPDALTELGYQVTKNAKEIIAIISGSLKAGKSRDQLEKEISEYLRKEVPQVKYFFDTMEKVDHPKPTY